MRNKIFEFAKRPISGLVRKTRQFEQDQSGVTAVEFAFVIGPFLALLFGVMKLGIIFFTMFSIDNAVEQASRHVRTGQAQTTAMTKEQFKAEVCALVPGYVDCSNNIRVDVQSQPELADISPPSGTDGGSDLSDDGDFNYEGGSGGDFVLVTVFFKWDSIPFDYLLDIGNLSDGSFLIRSSATFRNEPFTGS